jgi:hypothetical protein
MQNKNKARPWWKYLIFWIIAIILTIFTAYYQRLTGPTHPLDGEDDIEGVKIIYNFQRSHAGNDEHKVNVTMKDSEVSGTLAWKRYKYDEKWFSEPLQRSGDILFASLPCQPPAGKLLYQIILTKQNTTKKIPSQPVIIRFRGDVPAYFLIPHIIFIFLGLLFVYLTGIEALLNGGTKILVYLSVITLILGALVFGPIVQYYSFGEWWTGFPVGKDLTDTKMLIAIIFWIIPFIMHLRGKNTRTWVLIAVVITIISFFIPHSLLGSELDYNTYDQNNHNIR